MSSHYPASQPAHYPSVKATLCKRPATAANHLTAKAEGGTE